MALLSAANPTLLDLVKVMAPDGSIEPVAEILNATNDGIIGGITFQEGNMITGHRFGIRTALPGVSWGQLYKGVVPTKGNTAQVTENTGFLEAMSEMDSRLVDLASDPAMFRYIEDLPFVESMGQEFCRVLFKGTPADTDKFTGFEHRYNSTSGVNGDNVLLSGAGTDTDLFSMYLVGWSPMTVFGIVPKGSQAGLEQREIPRRWLENGDGNSGRMEVDATYFKMSAGLVVKDWRYVVRIANLDLSELDPTAATGVNLPFLMKDAIERVQNGISTNLAFYMNRSIRSVLRKQVASGVEASTLTIENVGGLSPQQRLMFDGIPVYRCDTLAAAETLVS
jgi:hypothetical protein